MNADELIGQIYGWLEENNDELRIEAVIDLPGFDWVEIHGMSDRNELLNISYRGLSLADFASGSQPIELVCRRDAITAIRRRKKSGIDDIFGRARGEHAEAG